MDLGSDLTKSLSTECLLRVTFLALTFLLIQWNGNELTLNYRLNFFCCIRAGAHLLAFMIRKSCAVEMRNVILSYHLK